jgi:hypothetical protein
LAFQRRNLSDSAFRNITDYLCGVSGNFWFAIAATSTAAPHELQAAISGTVYVFKSKKDWRDGPAEVVRSSIDNLNSLRLSLDEQRDQKISHQFSAARESLSKHADISLSFELHRGGEIYVAGPVFRNEELAYASKEFASQGGHDFNKWIADQSYFFMRDITHQHQHHAPSVDTILVLQKRGQDTNSWRRNILFSLHYYVISARRTRRAQALIQALGVLAYCQSFVGNCREAGCEQDAIPAFEESAIAMSLRAQIEEQEFAQHAKRQHDGNIFNTRLTAIAIFAPLLALIGVFIQPRIGTAESVQQFPTLNKASDFLSSYFSEIAGIFVLVFVVIWVLAALIPALREVRAGRDILRIGLINRSAAAFLSTLIGLIALGIGNHFGVHALKQLSEPISVLWQIIRSSLSNL